MSGFFSTNHSDFAPAARAGAAAPGAVPPEHERSPEPHDAFVPDPAVLQAWVESLAPDRAAQAVSEATVAQVIVNNFATPLATPPVAAPAGPDAGATTAADLSKAAVKYDAGKLRWDLLPWDAIEELVALFTVGAIKYDDDNWLKGFRYGRTHAALMRHLNEWYLAKLRGTDGLDHGNDQYWPQLGREAQSHLVAVVWNALALLTFELRGVGVDDRPGTAARPARPGQPTAPTPRSLPEVTG